MDVNFGLRRKELRIPIDVLVARSKVSCATVCKILRGQTERVQYGSISAVAKVLHISIATKLPSAKKVRREQANKKARRLVGYVQGTMGLEAQALSSPTVAKMVAATAKKLLAGTPDKLWE